MSKMLTVMFKNLPVLQIEDLVFTCVKGRGITDRIIDSAQ